MSLSDLSKITEWAVGVHLDQIKNIELILLKGHLFLEVAIDSTIHTLDKQNTSKLKDLSFHKKLQILESLRPNASSDMKVALGHLRKLNILRNRLAHELMFDGGIEDLGRWSEAVLADFPGTKFCRHTFRTKIIQSFGALARRLVDPVSTDETPAVQWDT
ncbi:MAG: hypothetical protein WC156_01350 [Pedobacter sp.]